MLGATGLVLGAGAAVGGRAGAAGAGAAGATGAGAGSPVVLVWCMVLLVYAGLVFGAARLALGVVVVLVCSGAAGAGGRAAPGAAAAGEAAAAAGRCWCWCPAGALVVVGVVVVVPVQQREEGRNYPAVGFGHWCEGLLLKRPACNCVFQRKDKAHLTLN